MSKLWTNTGFLVYSNYQSITKFLHSFAVLKTFSCPEDWGSSWSVSWGNSWWCVWVPLCFTAQSKPTVPTTTTSIEYTLNVQNIRNSFLILSCTPFCHQNSLNLSGQDVVSIPHGCWPMLTPMLPAVVSSWLDVLWVVDLSGATV